MPKDSGMWWWRYDGNEIDRITESMSASDRGIFDRLLSASFYGPLPVDNSGMARVAKVHRNTMRMWCEKYADMLDKSVQGQCTIVYMNIIRQRELNSRKIAAGASKRQAIKDPLAGHNYTAHLPKSRHLLELDQELELETRTPYSKKSTSYSSYDDAEIYGTQGTEKSEIELAQERWDRDRRDGVDYTTRTPRPGDSIARPVYGNGSPPRPPPRIASSGPKKLSSLLPQEKRT